MELLLYLLLKILPPVQWTPVKSAENSTPVQWPIDICWKFYPCTNNSASVISAENATLPLYNWTTHDICCWKLVAQPWSSRTFLLNTFSLTGWCLKIGPTDICGMLVVGGGAVVNTANPFSSSLQRKKNPENVSLKSRTGKDSDTISAF